MEDVTIMNNTCICEEKVTSLNGIGKNTVSNLKVLHVKEKKTLFW